MNCAELGRWMDQAPAEWSPEAIEHLRRCKRCLARHGLPGTLQQQEVQKGQGPAPGEAQFLERLTLLGQQQASPVQRAPIVDQKVRQGDRLFWRGEYREAEQEYQEALLLVRDDQGKAALYNKLARTQMHRYHPAEAIRLLYQALYQIGEEIPSSRSSLSFALLVEQLFLWGLLLLRWLRRWLPGLHQEKVVYGDRTRAAQHLYRELSILADGQAPQLNRWARLREMRLALQLGKPLELSVAYGRHAAFQAQEGWQRRARRYASLSLVAAAEGDGEAQAAAAFYAGRVAYLNQNWELARNHLEGCVSLCKQTRDYCLMEVALQHLIRVYRNDGSFGEAIRVAGHLLSLYHKLGHLPRLSASCRHFSLTYASFGDMRRAKSWARKALQVVESEEIQAEDRALSLLRCYVLLGDLEFRTGRAKEAQRYLKAGLKLQAEYALPPEYFYDGLELLSQIVEPPSSIVASPLRLWWQKVIGARTLLETEASRTLRSFSKVNTREHRIPEEIHYLYQEYEGDERQPGLRAAIPASPFATAFLEGEVDVQPIAPSYEEEAEVIASLFPVGAVSSRWGRGVLSKDRTGAITSQLSTAYGAPWGYFFADDIG